MFLAEGHTDQQTEQDWRVRHLYKFAPIQPEDQWKVGFIKELTNIKAGTVELYLETIEDDDNDGAFTSDDIDAILCYLCSS